MRDFSKLRWQYGTMLIYDLKMIKKPFAGHIEALLTDLSSDFDCIDHELLVANRDIYDFDKRFLILTLENKEHK